MRGLIVPCVLLVLIGYVSAGVKGISMAMDYNKQLVPPPSSLFSYEILNRDSSFGTEYDLVSHTNWTSLKQIYSSANVKLPGYVTHNDPAIDLFENKSAWKQWMNTIGLGTYVPTTYHPSQLNSVPFPVVLKTNQHYGRGVFVIQNAAELASKVQNITAQGHTFTLEEALTGMGYAEAASYGSVFNGTLLSARCMVRYFRPEQAAKSATYWNNNASTTSSTTTSTNNTSSSPQSDVFVRGFMLKFYDQNYIPCSQELVKITRKMFAEAPPYTGAYCSSIKTDSKGRFKMMEINARFCSSMVSNEALFIAAYVPLAFAIRTAKLNTASAMKNSTKVSKLSNNNDWYRSITYQRILTMEKKALRTGGGNIRGDGHNSAEFFSHTAKIEKPIYVQKG